MARAVIYTWIFNNTRGSLLFITLFHASSDTIGAFVGYENLIVTLAFDVILVLAFGAVSLSRRRQPVEEKDISTAAV